MSATQPGFVDDGYITGHLHPHVLRCGCCGKATRCIAIEGVELPKGITPQATILWDRVGGMIRSYIGIGCGCYAKFHRQVVHIRGVRG